MWGGVGGSSRFPKIWLDPPSAGPPRPKFRSFFPLSRPNFLSGVLSLNFGGVFEGRDASNVHVWALGLSCETPAASHDNLRTPKRAHFRAPALQTPPKFHEKTPQKEEKRTKMGVGEGKKGAKFWAPHPSGPHPFGPPPLRAPTPSGPTLGAPPFGAPPFGAWPLVSVIKKQPIKNHKKKTQKQVTVRLHPGPAARPLRHSAKKKTKRKVPDCRHTRSAPLQWCRRACSMHWSLI